MSGSSNRGIVIRSEDPVARSKAARLGMAASLHDGLGLDMRADWTLPWPHTLFIASGTCVPWDLVPVGFGFLERWDVAAPFWKAGTLAIDLGTPEERRDTIRLLHDLRVPVYAHELLFVRNSPAGKKFMAAWRDECALGDPQDTLKGCERLAFLRALYAVKPAFCVLPRLWLADIAQREVSDMKNTQRKSAQRGEPLVKVEIAPGRYVRCYERDRAGIVERYRLMAAGRHAK